MRSLVATTLIVLSLSLAQSCETTMPPLGAENDALVVGRLRTVQPNEVVLLPVDNQTGIGGLPLAALREEFKKGLIAQRYAPLALDYVDQKARPTEAAYRPGTLGEQAVLRVVLTNWDSSRWGSHATLVVDADVHLLDAANPDVSQALWGGHATRTVDLSLKRNTFVSDAAMLQRAVELAVEGIMVSLPARNPLQAAPAR